MTPFQLFLRRYYEPSTLPIVFVVGTAFVGCAYYCSRLLNHPEVVINRNHQQPWTSMSPTAEPRKFMLLDRKKLEQVQERHPARDY